MRRLPSRPRISIHPAASNWYTGLLDAKFRPDGGGFCCERGRQGWWELKRYYPRPAVILNGVMSDEGQSNVLLFRSGWQSRGYCNLGFLVRIVIGSPLTLVGVTSTSCQWFKLLGPQRPLGTRRDLQDDPEGPRYTVPCLATCCPFKIRSGEQVRKRMAWYERVISSEDILSGNLP